MTSKPHPAAMGRRRAFTLLELLVVVAVVMLLLALLFPSLALIRSRAQSVLCTNNLRQIGITMGREIMEREDDLYLFTLGQESMVGETWATRLDSAPHDPSLFVCPGAPPYTFDAGGTSWFGIYGIRRDPPEELIVQVGGGRVVLKTDRVSAPARFVVVADSVCVAAPGIIGHQSKYFYASGGASLIALRHRGKANCLFLDMHVEACDADALAGYGISAYAE